MKEIIYVFEKIFFVLLILIALKTMFIGPANLIGYFSNKKYREDFNGWMLTIPRYKSYKKR